MCREQLHILSLSGDNVCRVQQNVPLRVHILSSATNCAGATKCAVTGGHRSSLHLLWRKLGSLTCLRVTLPRTQNLHLRHDLNCLSARPDPSLYYA